MVDASLKIILDLINSNSRREFYWGNPTETSAVAYANEKAILQILVESPNSFELLHRFTWLMTLAENPSSEEIQKNYAELMNFFNLTEVGVPSDEITSLTNAVVELLKKYVNSGAQITELSDFQTTKAIYIALHEKYRNDPRFKKKFDDAAWGWS